MPASSGVVPVGSSADRRFGKLYRECFADVLAYCLRRSPSADGYDAANEVFAIAWRRIDDVPRGDAARPWLFVIARRVVHRRWRGVRRFRRLVDKVASVRDNEPAGPEAEVVRHAEYEAVLEAAGRLSRTDREVLNLAAWEGLAHREIAEVLGCSVAAVDQRLHRAKTRLARQYHSVCGSASRSRVVGGEGS